MTWTFHLSANDERRLRSRVLLVLDQQMVTIRLFHAEADENRVQIMFIISSEEDKMYRIESLLRRLQDVNSISVLRQ